MDKTKFMNIVSTVAPILVGIGALNFLFIGLFENDLLEELIGDGGRATSTTPIAKMIYILIGLSAIYTLGWIPIMLNKINK